MQVLLRPEVGVRSLKMDPDGPVEMRKTSV